MLYLISGCSRTGKTMLAKKILQQKGITYLSLDWIVMGFTNGMPQCGIHDKLFPHEIADGIANFLDAMCESVLWTEAPLVIEGEAIMPHLARSLMDRHPELVKACFLGYAEVEVGDKFDLIRQFSSGHRDWLTQESDDYIRDHVQNMIAHSQMVKEKCANQGVCYIDTSDDFVAAMDKAYQYLMAE